MASIGPEIPSHLLKRSTTHHSESEDEEGPAPPPSIGPAIPPELLKNRSADPPPEPHPAGPDAEDDDDEDDYAPALPPDLLASRGAGQAGVSAPPGPSSSRRVLGPSFPDSQTYKRSVPPSASYDDEDSDDDVGPKPLPYSSGGTEKDGVAQFMEIEERRRKQIEEAAKPKALKREEWMLVPPSSSDLMSSLDPTRLTKPRTFARTAAPEKNTDSSLWTETPQERLQRLQDEVSGKKRKVTSGVGALSREEELEARKKARRDAEIRMGVEEHTRKTRGFALVEQHKERTPKDSKDGEPPAIWDHSRDMALGGRLMDDKTRDKMLRDARGLGERFGTGKSGGFL